MTERALDILLVEDNPGDARLVSEAFKEKGSSHRLVHISDGQAAMDYLHAKMEKKENRPALILLDLNLPRLHGREVLARIKGHPQLKSIPVVVFTTSHAPEDVQQVYNLNANCYVTKPGDLDNFLQVVGVIQDFWLNTVQLPALRE